MHSTRSGDGKRSLLGRDAPGLWYEALAALPPQPSADAAAPPVSDAKVCTSRAAVPW